MSASDDSQRVHFQSPDYLVERLEAITDIYVKDQTDVLIAAIPESIENTTDRESFQELVATTYSVRPAGRRNDHTTRRGRDRPATPRRQIESR